MHNVGLLPQNGARGAGWCVGLSNGTWTGFVCAGRDEAWWEKDACHGHLEKLQLCPSCLPIPHPSTDDSKWSFVGLARGPAVTWVLSGWCCEDRSTDVRWVTTWHLTWFLWSLPAVALVIVSTFHHYHLDFPFLFSLASFSLDAP